MVAIVKNWYVYGNYIDEALLMNGCSDSVGLTKYYAHDHLYSPAALMYFSGGAIERYEYDAYGKVKVLDADFTDDTDNKSDYGNPYYFTGRQLDELDDGNLKLICFQDQQYDPYTGRWLNRGPDMHILIYEYMNSNPVNLALETEQMSSLSDYLYGCTSPAKMSQICL